MRKYVLMWAEEDHNYYDLEPILLNYGPRSKKTYGYGINDGITFGKGFHAEFYLPEQELKRMGKLGYSFLMNKAQFKRLLKDINSNKQAVVERIKALLTLDLKKLSNHELFDIKDFYGFNYGKLMRCYILTQPHQVKRLENELFQFLKKRKIEDVAEAVSTLTTPKTKFVFLKAGNELFKSFAETIEKETAKIDKTLINKKLVREVKARQTEKNNLLKKLNPPAKIKHIIEVLTILAEERLKMRFVWMPAIYYNELFLTEIKRRFKIPKRILRMYDSTELDDLMLKGKKLTSEQLGKRKNGFLKILRNGEVDTFEGKKAQEILDEITKRPEDLNELAGMVASKGFAVGKVVNLSYKMAKEHSRKIQKMQQGDIIVTEMTRPNIIAACEKAGAIITDEGGVLCHAAIVSRELMVPCVIGTIYATSILKDGDYVEVDAEKGVIKKISKNEYLQNKTKPIKRKISKIIILEHKEHRIKKGDIFWFKDVDKKDLHTVGGKGANLGELYKFANVPNGFCVAVASYKRFLDASSINAKIGRILKGINIANPKNLESKSKQIQKLILSKKIPLDIQKNISKYYKELGAKKVAVRSSATAEDLPSASFAGQQDTYLNITGENAVVHAVQRCWASLFTSRAIYYREKHGIDHNKVYIAVVIQQMIQPKYAGVMFTKDPLDKKHILIEVVKGLGEKLVSGEVTPSSYLIDKSNYLIIRKKELFEFNHNNLTKLSEVGQHLEKHFKFPQDVEWAIDAQGTLFILQSRAITT